jgi:hypothetical protein
VLFDPVSRLIAMGEKADIATLDLSDDDLRRIGKSPMTLWPPVHLMVTIVASS